MFKRTKPNNIYFILLKYKSSMKNTIEILPSFYNLLVIKFRPNSEHQNSRNRVKILSNITVYNQSKLTILIFILDCIRF